MNLQTFSNEQKSFVFCDFDWHDSVQNTYSAAEGKSGIYFTDRKGVFVWECGFFSGAEIVDAYLKYGKEKCFEHIDPNNSSFVLYDAQQEIIIAARDFIGYFPLFYFQDTENKEFIFSFSMNALLKSKLFEPQINYAKIVEYVEYKVYDAPDNQTFYENVNRVLQGCRIEITQGGGLENRLYRKLNLQQYQSFSDEQYIKRFRELFIESVKRHIEPYPKIAGTLSGGLDSSSVCGVAQSFKTEPINTYNFNTNTAAAQEDEYIEAVVNKWHNKHQTITSKYSQFDALVKIIEQNAQPHFTFNHTIQLDLIDAAKQSSCEVLMSGHWGDQTVTQGFQYIDELFDAKDWKQLKKTLDQRFNDSLYIVKTDDKAFNPNKNEAVKDYIVQKFSAKIRHEKNWKKLPETIWILHKYFDCGIKDFVNLVWRKLTRKRATPPAVIGKLIRDEIRAKGELIKNKISFEKLNLSEITDVSPDYPQKRHLEAFYSANSIYGQEDIFEIYRQNSLKNVQPFFNAELLELNLSIPQRLKWGDGRKRNTLRRAMKDYLPEKVANRTTKGEFSDYYGKKLIELIKEFNEKVPQNHLVWTIINKVNFDEHVKIILDDEQKMNDKKFSIIPVARTINLAIWLDFFENLKK